ncbi:PAS domain S-box protein [Stieleria sp. JC731]|uniref:two-component system sensor histidine kinase NtrB n=1 Tax=Pirellulaceae TaxID=2691357 RepID=UPI001E5669FF|nr:PAS domain S-box protein [Stieleria sp. JC731]MCC9601733.1 PAS domain S-box protein [Stieleria sp. JC731]
MMPDHIPDNASDAERLAQLEAILNNAVDAIITIDQKGLIQSINPATEAMFGYDQQSLIGQNISMLMPEPDKSQHDGYIDHYNQTGERKIIGIGREVEGRRRDGSTFPLHLAVSVYQVGGKRFFTGIVRDITDIKTAERNLASANEELAALNNELENRVQLRSNELSQAQGELVRKEKFAAMGRVSGGIAHEIRNPLNVLKSSAYFLLNAQDISEEKKRDHLQRIERQVGMIDGIVTALSETSGMHKATVKPIHLKQVFEELCSQEPFPENVRLTCDFDTDTPMVMADPKQLQIVFRNVLRNACDAMPDGGDISITVKESDGVTSAVVRDTGGGIDSEQLEQIMEPFYTTKARGMGLGLSICKMIMDKNHGLISIDSQQGVGTAVTLQMLTASPIASVDA